jgi:ribosomal protein L40E
MEEKRCLNCGTMNPQYATTCKSCGFPFEKQTKIIPKNKLKPETYATILITATLLFNFLFTIEALQSWMPEFLLVILLIGANLSVYIGFTISIVHRNIQNIFLSIVALSWMIIINVGVFLL